MVQMLLDKGVDVNAQGGYYVIAQGGYYDNALQAASFEGHDEVVRLLLNHGAVLSGKDLQGRTPSHLASARGGKKIVTMLSSFGSDLTIVDMQGRNCLHHAASAGSVELVNWLLKEGFDPNLADRDGWTSLHWAAKNGSGDTIEVLKAAGASSTIESIEGWTAHSVTIFHHDEYTFLSDDTVVHEDLKSELAVKWGINSSIAAVELTGDESKISPGNKHTCFCDGCLLVSFGLYNPMNSSFNANRKYMVHVTNARTVRILTTALNAKIHQTRPTLVTSLKKSNKQSKPQLIVVSHNTFISMTGRSLNHCKRSTQGLN